MIIWSGLGFLVPVGAFVCFLITQIATNSLLNDERYYTEHGFPKLIAFWVAAGLMFLVGRPLSNKDARVLVDKQTGQEVILKPSHTFFFIPIEYWAPILLVLGIVFLFI